MESDASGILKEFMESAIAQFQGSEISQGDLQISLHVTLIMAWRPWGKFGNGVNIEMNFREKRLLLAFILAISRFCSRFATLSLHFGWTVIGKEDFSSLNAKLEW